jgi:hydroxyacylglutathione hydrolase
MYFQQFYLTCLAHASYMIGSEGVAAVVDPQRDVGIYLEDAEKHGLKISHIIETHLHADFVSGHQELAARTGAKIHVGVRAGAQFPHHDVNDGDEIAFGRAVLRFLETPGHSGDSICVLLTDLDRAPQPWAVLTGDTLFIGEVGRPDLSPDHTAEELASMLYDSLHAKLLKLPDNVEIYPAHGAGSLCGRNISPERQSTIGKERAFNYALRPMSREDFIRLMVTDLPERPEYFYRDKEINRAGAPAVADLPKLPALSAQDRTWQSCNRKTQLCLIRVPPLSLGQGTFPALSTSHLIASMPPGPERCWDWKHPLSWWLRMLGAPKKLEFGWRASG